MKISLRFFTRGFLNFSVDANLPVEFDPVKPKRGVRISLELFPLCALVICKEHEPVVIETLEQNNSHGRSAIATGGGETHCINVPDPGLNGSGKPISELFHRVTSKVAPAQTLSDVIVTQSRRIACKVHL